MRIRGSGSVWRTSSEVEVGGDDKDAAFFPEPVLSPAGVRSFAFYHRPMLHLSAVDGRAAIPMIERMPFEDRESIRIAYVPVDAVKADIKNLLEVKESVLVLSPNEQWGSIKVGSGTPPLRIEEGWMSVFHGVDLLDNNGAQAEVPVRRGNRDSRYRAAGSRALSFARRRSAGPKASTNATASSTTSFSRPVSTRARISDARTYDVYYGMADFSIGAFRMKL